MDRSPLAESVQQRPSLKPASRAVPAAQAQSGSARDPTNEADENMACASSVSQPSTAAVETPVLDIRAAAGKSARMTSVECSELLAGYRKQLQELVCVAQSQEPLCCPSDFAGKKVTGLSHVTIKAVRAQAVFDICSLHHFCACAVAAESCSHRMLCWSRSALTGTN